MVWLADPRHCNPLQAYAASIDSTGIKTTRTQLYTGAVTIGGNATLNGTTVTFNDTIDDSALDTHNLTIGGNAVFDGSVGETTPLGLPTVNGTTAINTTEINTFLGGGDGEQVYKGNVTLETTDFTIFLDATAVLFFDNLTLGATASTATDELSVPESEIGLRGQLTSTLTGNGQVGFISAAEADMTVGSPNVNLVYSNFSPAPGDQFDLVQTTGGILGAFTNASSSPSTIDGVGYDVTYLGRRRR